jgi:hypothetical protein
VCALDADAFASTVSTPAADVAVLLTAPWCTHCAPLSQAWERLARAHARAGDTALRLCSLSLPAAGSQGLRVPDAFPALEIGRLKSALEKFMRSASENSSSRPESEVRTHHPFIFCPSFFNSAGESESNQESKNPQKRARRVCAAPSPPIAHCAAISIAKDELQGSDSGIIRILGPLLI